MFHLPAVVTNAAGSVVCEDLFKALLSLPWGLRPEVKLLGHVAVLGFIFGGIVTLFSAADRSVPPPPTPSSL